MSYFPCCCGGCPENEPWCVEYSSPCQPPRTVYHQPDNQCCPCVEIDLSTNTANDCYTLVCGSPIAVFSYQGDAILEYSTGPDVPGVLPFPEPAPCPAPECCPEDPVSIIGAVTFHFDKTLSVTPVVLHRKKRIEFCVYYTDVLCPDAEEPVKKWVVFSRLWLEVSIAWSGEGQANYYRELNGETGVCFDRPGLDTCVFSCTFNSHPCNSGNPDDVQFWRTHVYEQKEYYFERIRFFDEKPSGSIDFSIEDKKNGCEVLDCHVGTEEFWDIAAVDLILPCTPCQCNLSLIVEEPETESIVVNSSCGSIEIPNCGEPDFSPNPDCFGGYDANICFGFPKECYSLPRTKFIDFEYMDTIFAPGLCNAKCGPKLPYDTTNYCNDYGWITFDDDICVNPNPFVPSMGTCDISFGGLNCVERYHCWASPLLLGCAGNQVVPFIMGIADCSPQAGRESCCNYYCETNGCPVLIPETNIYVCEWANNDCPYYKYWALGTEYKQLEYQADCSISVGQVIIPFQGWSVELTWDCE